MGVHDKFYKIIQEYNKAYSEVWEKGVFTHPLLDFFNNDVKTEVLKIVGYKKSELIVKSSTGAGRTAKTPWIAILDPRITTKASEGTYIVYLFNKDEQSIYLTLEQSYDEAEKRAKGLQKNDKALKSSINQILEDEKNRVLNIISVGDFKTDSGISTGKKDYDITAIAYKKYDIDTLAGDEELKQDLFKMIDIYEEYYEKCTIKNSGEKDFPQDTSNEMKYYDDEGEADIEFGKDFEENNQGVESRVIVENVKNTLQDIYLYIRNQDMVIEFSTIKNLYLSLKSKPFVILAGISGTGKSKIARLFTEAIGGEYKLIPVRPDWSDSSDLLGHINLDNKFIPGAVTNFLAEANRPENLNKPYVLCLDEMNLARVEYYFSDFLSILETRRINNKGRIVSDNIFAQTEFGSDIEALDKYKNIHISENVYIIGTVNMDETTFPFSKKVLDRANTIEFSDVNLSMNIDNSLVVESMETKNVDNSFLKSEYISFNSCYLENQEDIDQMIFILEKINRVLKIIGAQVAYRVRNEIGYYVAYAKRYNLFSFNEAIDFEFMQKILPRVQGSSGALMQVFRDLSKIMIGTEDFNDNELLEQIEKYINSHIDGDGRIDVDYPNSTEKIVFMLRRLMEDGYTSYWL